MNTSNIRTLLDALEHAALSQATLTFHRGRNAETVLSYQDLLERASELLGRLQNAGINSGQELIVYVDDNQILLEAFWACQMGGMIAVPLAVGSNDMHRQKLFNVFKTLAKPRLFTTRNIFAQIEGTQAWKDENEIYHRMAQSIIDTEEDTEPGNLSKPYPVQPEDICFIQFSSGSTGQPKGVVLSHHNVLENIRAIINDAGIHDRDRLLNWMPLTHDMGMIGFHLTGVVAAVPQWNMPTELFVRRPQLWLEKLSELKATMTSSPNFGYKHLLKRFRLERCDNLDLSSVRLIFNGAEQISAELCRKFCAALQPLKLASTVIYPVYGLAEASLAVSFPPPESNLRSVFVLRESLQVGNNVGFSTTATAETIELVCVGNALTGSEVRIVGQSGEQLPQQYLGQILIRGPNVTAGYYRADSIDTSAFVSGDWLDTGDLGFFSAGRLYIAGRSKELIIINGRNLHPYDLEALCEAIDGVELGKVAACAIRREEESVDELAIFVLHRGDDDSFAIVANEIRKVLNQRVGIDPSTLVAVRTIPKTSSGKIRRFELVNNYLDSLPKTSRVDQYSEIETGELDDDSNLELLLLRICMQTLGEKKLGVTDNLFEVGASSLKLAEVFEQIEQRFPDMIEMTDLFDLPTIADLARFLAEKRAA